jgi:hypothetical protein
MLLRHPLPGLSIFLADPKSLRGVHGLSSQYSSVKYESALYLRDLKSEVFHFCEELKHFPVLSSGFRVGGLGFRV